MGTLAAGIKEIFATAKTTGTNVMLCGNDGTPDGHMTMANLASVLGESIHVVTTSYDLNDWNQKNGYFYGATNQFDNVPNGFDGSTLLLKQHFFGGERYIQEISSILDVSCSMIRYRDSQGVANNWIKTSTSYINSYPNLSSLANALGVSGFLSFDFRAVFVRQRSVNVDVADGNYGIYFFVEHNIEGGCVLIFSTVYNRGSNGLKVIFDAGNYIQYISKPDNGTSIHISGPASECSLYKLRIH